MSMDISSKPPIAPSFLHDHHQALVNTFYFHIELPSGESRLLSYMQFRLLLQAEMKSLNELVLIRGVNRTFKLKQLENVMAYFGKISQSFDLLNSKVDETRLLAINTLISASLCGLSGAYFAEVVKQVNLLCQQSKFFLNDINTGIESTQIALDGVLNLIKSNIKSEINVVTALRTRVDFYLEKLSIHPGHRNNQDDRNNQAGIDCCPALNLIESDFQKLRSSIVAAHNHVATMISKRHQTESLVIKIGLCLKQLKILSAASLLIN